MPNFKLEFKGNLETKNYILEHTEDFFTKPLEAIKGLKEPFCFYLSKGEQIVAARSLFYAKPLYYYKNSATLFFDFSKKDLLSIVPKELDLSALSEYLSFMSAKKSFFKGLFELGGGELLVFKDKKLQILEFDDLKGISPSFDSPELASSKILEILEQNITKYLELHPACLLSGGLDSSILCSLYSKLSKEPITAFNLSFSSASRYDESAYARYMADFLGIKLYSIDMNKEDFLAGFEALYDELFEPHSDSALIALKFLCQKITQMGFKTLFSAEGADEGFLGYNLYFRVNEFYQNNAQIDAYPLISKDREYLRRKGLNLPIYGSFCEVFTRYQKELLFGKNKELIKEDLASFDSDYKDFCAMRYIDFKIASNGGVLRKLSLMPCEIFTPFLMLSKYALSIENPSPNNEPKELLKLMAKNYNLLPPKIISRKKKGLSTPFLEWVLAGRNISDEILQTNEILGFKLFSEVFVKELEIRAKKGRFKQHLWTLLNFAKWLEKHFG